MSYTFKGTEFKCQDIECFLTDEVYRGHHSYGHKFYMSILQGVSESGDSFGIVMETGIGEAYTGTDRATEDHININGSVHKLDATLFDVQDHSSMSMKTQVSTFPDNSCELKFHSEKQITEG